MSGEGHSNLFIFVIGLIRSTGMGMPVSSFPDPTAHMLSYVYVQEFFLDVPTSRSITDSATREDEMRQLYFSNVLHFLNNGVPASAVTIMVQLQLHLWVAAVNLNLSFGHVRARKHSL